MKYLACIEKVDRGRTEMRALEFKQAVDVERDRAEQIEKNKDAVLNALLEECRKRSSGKLDFMGERYENSNPFVCGSSAASAAIVEILHKDGAFVAIDDVLSILAGSASLRLCKEWVAFIDRILSESKEDSATWRSCIMLLHGKGGQREKYHGLLRRWAVEQQNVAALSAILFRADPDSGELMPVITLDNLVLMKALSKKDKIPGIRVTCAHYAARLRDYDLAQAVCEDLLRQPYARKSGVPINEDRALSYARDAALTLGFYGLKNERMFRLVYDRATVLDREPATPVIAKDRPNQPVDQDWVSLGAYVLGSMEIKAAKQLIGQLSAWAEDDASGNSDNRKGTQNEKGE